MTKKIPPPEDSDLFRHSIGKVRPVINDKVLLQKQEKPGSFPKPFDVGNEDNLTVTLAGAIVAVSPEDTLSYSVPGLQKNVLKKMRKGQYGLDAAIDLHGLSRDAAKKQLLNFLRRCVIDGCRCVHIVHGKGYRSPDNYPMLKNDVNVWLRQHQDVLAFCSAPAKDGGAGAVFVLLQSAGKFQPTEQAE